MGTLTYMVDDAVHWALSKTMVAQQGAVWIFDDVKMFLLMNVALGGNLGGSVPPPSRNRP